MPERPSPYQQPTWPTNCPRPGDSAWPDGAVRWLYDHVPDGKWHHRALGQHPYFLVAAALIQVRAHLESHRTLYREAAARWSTFLPDATVRKFLADAGREGQQLTTLMGELAALEEALMPEMIKGHRSAGEPPVSGGP